MGRGGRVSGSHRTANAALSIPLSSLCWNFKHVLSLPVYAGIVVVGNGYVALA